MGNRKSWRTQTAIVGCCDINVEKYVFYTGLIVIVCLNKTSWFENELLANRISKQDNGFSTKLHDVIYKLLRTQNVRLLVYESIISNKFMLNVEDINKTIFGYFKRDTKFKSFG